MNRLVILRGLLSKDSYYECWKQEFERQKIYGDTILVDHSCEAGLLIRWLYESCQSVKRLVLAVP